MEIFHETNREKLLWMGFSDKYGWVILDRTLPANKPSHRAGEKLYFIKCSNWSIFQEEKGKWEYPEYIFVVSYLENLNEKDKVIKEQEGINILNEFLNSKRLEINHRYIETIHKDYLEKKGLPSRTVIKSKRGLNPLKRRDSVCWSCHDTVDNKFDYECGACKWIICSNCGACEQFGCGFRKKEMYENKV